MMTGKTLCALALTGLVLSGCTAADVRGTPAASVEECRADFQTEMRSARSGSLTGNSLASAIVAVFVSATATNIAQQNATDRYRACLARFGTTPEALGETPAASAAAQTPRQRQSVVTGSGGCTSGSSVLVGGTGYCVR